MQIAILGRQPSISLAELEAIYGAKSIIPISEYAALVNSDSPLSQTKLGGTMKSARILNTLENSELAEAFSYLQEFLPEHLMYLPEGKLQLGVSIYGYKAQRDWLLKQMLTLKKVIKKTGQSVRIIENKTEILESAQVLYNKLTSELGCEILLIKQGNNILVAQTTGVQNIDDYSKRDFDRPKRDSYVGMLPPKLAQIMINLANPATGTTVLDPFCGTGVVLQEALLMGTLVYGTDISEKMIRYSRDNLNWLQELYSKSSSWYLEEADATKHTWRQPIDTVVCETYLGKPLIHLPNGTEFKKITEEANVIARDFLKNIAPQLKQGARLSIALPAWNLGNNRFYHLPLLDQLEDLGYNRLEFDHAKSSELIYYREDQIVARELTILEKI